MALAFIQDVRKNGSATHLNPVTFLQPTKQNQRMLKANLSMSSSEQSDKNNEKKRKGCLGYAIPSQTRKIWLIPHIAGFLCFMLVTYRTYEVPEVNEGINTALAQIQRGSPKGVKTFAQITNIEDTWAFLETNVLKALRRAETDYNGQDHLAFENLNINMHIRGKNLPVTFLPLSIEQIRDSQPPQCKGFEKKTKAEKVFVQALEGKCDKVKNKAYLDLYKYGNSQTVASINGTEVVTSVGKCPGIVALNLTYDPFSEIDSKLRPGMSNKVYAAKNLSPRNSAGQQPEMVLQLLKNCYWTDLATRELFISLPFVVRGTSVFGAVQYTITYSISGSASKQYRVAYAKHIQTADEYYADLNSKDKIRRNSATTSLIARIFMTVYLILDIVLKNFKNIHAAFIKKVEVKEKENKNVKKAKLILKAIFPGMNEYISMFLLVSALILPALNANVNLQVDGLQNVIGDVGSGKVKFDYKVAEEFNKYLSGAQTAMTFVKSFVVIIITSWMFKLLIIFNNTEHVNIVPQTLIKSLPKILNLMVVILTMVGAFALMSMVCYGHISRRWTNPLMMLLEVYSMMLGEYGDQYAEMYSHDRIIAIILFFYFSVILMMTLMNVFMSVVLDTYAEINSEEYQKKLVEAREKEVPMDELESSAPPTKKIKCTRPKLPHRRSKWWLLPHILGFMAYLLYVYRTYDLAEVNEGMNAADSYISTNDGSKVIYDGTTYTIKAFDEIQSHSDVWQFLRSNLIPVMANKMDTDVLGKERTDVTNPQNTLPFIFFPVNIEQYRRPTIPICHGLSDNIPAKEVQYLKGLGVDCSTLNERKFGVISSPPAYNLTEFCPSLASFNLTVNPFEPTEPLFNTDKMIQAYRLVDLASYTAPFDVLGGGTALQSLINTLKSCYWIDLSTRELQISLPFVVKGSGVFGNLQYSLTFSDSGVPSKRKLVNYARKTKTSVDDIIILLCQAFVGLYLIIEIVLRNSYRIYSVCCKKSETKSQKLPLKTRVVKVLLAFFPGIPEYISMGLLFAILVAFPVYIAAINKPVENMVIHIGKLDANFGHIRDGVYTRKLADLLMEAQTAGQTFNGYVLVCTGAFLLKMMIVFSETEHVDVVPLTLWKSLAPIWNLIVVIVALMLAFAGIAMVLFGHIVHRWTNPFTMMLEVYQMMLGDWGDHYGEMYAQDRLMAVLLFLFFSIVLMMTVINIFLSVVLDTYSKVNDANEVGEVNEDSEASATKVVPVSISNTNMAGNVERLREVRRMYGADSSEYKSAVEEVKLIKASAKEGAKEAV